MLLLNCRVIFQLGRIPRRVFQLFYGFPNGVRGLTQTGGTIATFGDQLGSPLLFKKAGQVHHLQQAICQFLKNLGRNAFIGLTVYPFIAVYWVCHAPAGASLRLVMAMLLGHRLNPIILITGIPRHRINLVEFSFNPGWDWFLGPSQ